MLRVLLAAYLGNSPERIVLSYSKYGKPLLSMGLKSSDLNFNISHAEGIAVFSFAKNIQVGIDIERAQQDRNCLEISEHFFSDYEREYLRFLSDKPLNEAFIRCWTRKEAFVKAKGEGLSMPFHQFDVSLGEDEPASLLATRPDPEEALRWTLNDLAIETGYVAAVACERANCVEGEPVIVENRSQVVSKAPMIFSIGI
jgi:4'-phosphopantetheinyl transferase